ncbi:hypothetical protein WM28_10690 [Burkholderia ubonensis]|uniref:hypothetical protein n=1 Tax=Burkholderia ubonensis TaxID=101571 RepID=UPI0007523510|nr:hypothetical protein [Burkholderia ubonensis]KWN78346.1 hypothetical protein WM24_29660 [Burkholderia ubonensis]KWO23242.1 hypothetical protein WM27_09630 [Burkholderia ubonensis]KWO52940.1 hypothetical protein WM28_10690 [Burkholderia ubonensis]ODQ34530.1 hypothetical protein BGV65_12160 [Burkholderia ubonensis]
MKVEQIIKQVGGRRAICGLTGVTESLISHWIKRNYISSHWIRFFIALKPELDWPDLLHGNTSEYTDLMNHEHVIRSRLASIHRLRSRVKRLKQEHEQLVGAPADQPV